jgi:hypothetical protein
MVLAEKLAAFSREKKRASMLKIDYNYHLYSTSNRATLADTLQTMLAFSCRGKAVRQAGFAAQYFNYKNSITDVSGV